MNRKNKFVLIGVVLVVVLVAVGVGYSYWGRRVIYRDGRSLGRYPGGGREVTMQVGKVLVIPKMPGEMTYLEKEDQVSESVYSQGDSVYPLPAQEQLRYAVGRVVGWEMIVGSQDRYLSLANLDTGEVDKYRVGYAKSELFGFDHPDATVLREERVAGRMGLIFNRENVIENVGGGYIEELGWERVDRLIRLGDAVVVTPVFSPPDYAKRDERGVELARNLIFRRGISWFSLIFGGSKNE